MARNKKLLLSGLCIALFAVLGIFGTVAYFTDTDDDVNVMTVGNVQIDQIEQQRGENGLEDFEQGQNIDPVYGNTGDKVKETINGYEIGNFRNLETIENYTDKIVTVENTGKNPAYVRTIIAFPTAGYNSGEQAYAEWLHWNGVSDTDTAKNNGWMWGRDRSEWPGNTDNWDKVEDVMINGVEYDIYVATNKNVIEPGEATAPSLLGFYLDASLNYDEGGYYFEPNGVKTYIGDISDLNILVATQACQTDLGETAWDALDVAFGDITAQNHPWLKTAIYSVGNDKELKDALQDTESEMIVVNLSDDVTYDIAAWDKNAMGGENTKDIVINGNGNTITFNQKDSDWDNIVTNGAELTIRNANITNTGYNNGPWNRHDLNFACDVVLENVVSDKAMAFKAGATLKNVTINDANTSDTYAIWIQPNGQTVTLDGCTIDMIACSDGRGIKIDEQYVDAPAKVTLNVSDTTFKTEEKAAIIVKSAAGADINLSNVNIAEVAADSTNAVWVDEASASYADLVLVIGGTKIVEP